MWSIVEAWLYGLILLAIVWASTIPALARRRRYVAFEERTGICAGCGYSLAGLPEAARCPECGLVAPEKIIHRERGEREFRWSRARLFAPLLPVVLILPILVPVAWYGAWRWHGWSHRAVVRLVLWKEQDYTESVTASMAAMALAAPLVVSLLRSERRGARRWGIVGAHAGAFAGLGFGARALLGASDWELAMPGALAAVGMFTGAAAAVLVRRVIRR